MAEHVTAKACIAALGRHYGCRGTTPVFAGAYAEFVSQQCAREMAAADARIFERDGNLAELPYYVKQAYQNHFGGPSVSF